MLGHEHFEMMTSRLRSIGTDPSLRAAIFSLALAGTFLGAETGVHSASAQVATQASLSPLADKQAAQFNALISEIARRSLPHTFEDMSDWGLTDTRWDGLDVHRDGWRIKTKRRRREVNHGDWKMVTCELIDPERLFQVALSDIRVTDENQTRFRVDVDAQLRLHGRVAKWVKGVQLLSLSADANARIRLRLDCEVAVEMEMVHLPPDLQLRLDVVGAELVMDQFDVYSVSKLGGESAEQIGRAMRHLLEKKLTEKQERLVAKINREIDEHESDFRLSLHDVFAEEE